MKLSMLLKNVELLETQADLQTELCGISADSRTVKPGELFVALTGFESDGHRFIPMAAEKGASAVICEKKPTVSVPYILVRSARAALAQIAANYYDHPADKLKMIGVTGTNGKTTVTYLLKTILEQTIGAKVGLIGTIQNMIGERVIETERTTPDIIELQDLLHQMVEAGCTHAVMEVSSHALMLHRVDGIHFAVGAFTNLTEDHLDFHKTMDAYCDAKALLFQQCDVGVLNLDDFYYERIRAQATCRTMSFSTKQNCADLAAKNIRLKPDRIETDVVIGSEIARLELGIPGAFSVYNALTVTLMAIALGIPLAAVSGALKNAKGVKGRMEVVPTPKKEYTVIIDYCHTPDSMENALQTVNGFCRGRVFAVFGCGGDRDPFKRPIMGRIAQEYADVCVVTSDNPRTEDPNEIIRQITADMQTPVIIENRAEAIGWALANAEAQDVILLCGKGHETYQEINHVKNHLDEREIVAAYLEKEV